MRHAGIESIAEPPLDLPRRAAAGRGAAVHEASFQSHMAAFYPYAQPPVDPQPRAGAAADERQRGGAVGAAGATQRRQSRRGDA